MEGDGWGLSMTPAWESTPNLDQLFIYPKNMKDMEWVQKLSK